MENSGNIWFVLLIFLIFMSGFFSASETALTALSKAKVRKLKEEKRKGAERIEKLLSNTPRLLSTILIGNNLVNILAAAIATKLAVDRFQDIGVGIATGALTVIVLIFGEITPKTFAIRHSEKVALSTVWAISAISYVLYPVGKVFVLIANTILRIFGQKAIEQGPFATPEELKALVAIGEEEGVIEKEERKMIHSILEFGDTIVREVMVPRTDMVCVEKNQSVEEALVAAQEKGYSRIPVYEENIDNIVGILYVKDMLNFVAAGKTSIQVRELAREAYYVPETKRVDDLLREFQKKKIHMAIVFDEHGGTAGLVTLEDLLEEIVGEIFDEYDFEEEKRIEEVAEGEWIFDGRVDIDAVEELLEIDLSEEESETIGGFVTTLLGHLPNEGEKAEYENYEFIVEKVSARRVKKVRVRKLSEKKDENLSEHGFLQSGK